MDTTMVTKPAPNELNATRPRGAVSRHRGLEARRPTAASVSALRARLRRFAGVSRGSRGPERGTASCCQPCWRQGFRLLQ